MKKHKGAPFGKKGGHKKGLAGGYSQNKKAVKKSVKGVRSNSRGKKRH